MAPPPFPDGVGEANARAGNGFGGQFSLWSLVLLGSLLALASSGLLGGGRSDWRRVEAPAAILAVHTPQVVRNGVFFETRIRITARTDLAEPVLAVPPSLWRDMTINSEFPDPKEQAFKDGAFRFTYDRLAAGETLELKFDGQVNPPLFAGTGGRLVLMDGERPIAGMDLRTTVLP